ncbi:MAG: class I tRNA ligase family protein, partial [Spirochaetes bacterium]|nr:class I tRNA ligase family protein [Spirochaetota bacterium]
KIDNLEFNTAISQLMILVNLLQKQDKINTKVLKTLNLLLHPFAPFITEELWEMLGEKPSISQQNWPVFDPAKVVDDVVTIVFQVNGKVRAKVELAKDLSKEEMIDLALNNERVKGYTEGKEVIKQIAVPNKLVNIVVK